MSTPIQTSPQANTQEGRQYRPWKVFSHTLTTWRNRSSARLTRKRECWNREREAWIFLSEIELQEQKLPNWDLSRWWQTRSWQKLTEIWTPWKWTRHSRMMQASQWSRRKNRDCTKYSSYRQLLGCNQFSNQSVPIANIRWVKNLFQIVKGILA